MADYHQQQFQQQQQQQQHPNAPPAFSDHPMPQQPAGAYQPPQPMNEKASTATTGAEHQPSRPSNNWSFGFWDCFKPLDVCCLSYWCPCYVFGKTYERNKTSEKDPSGLNGMCCAWYCLAMCGFSPCFQCITRGTTREKFNIEGNMGMDFLAACCCPCCVLVQEEKESVVRMTGMDPTTGAAYQPVPQMRH